MTGHLKPSGSWIGVEIPSFCNEFWMSPRGFSISKVHSLRKTTSLKALLKGSASAPTWSQGYYEKEKKKRKIRKEKKIVPAKSHASEAALLPQRSEATEADAFFPSPIEQRFCHHPQRSNCIRMGQSLWGERGCRTIWAHHPDEQDSTADPSSHSMNPAPVRSRTPPGSGPTECNTGFWSSHSPVCWTWVVPFFKMGSISAQNPITQIGWWVNNKHSLITLSTIVLLFLSAYFLLQQWRRDLRGKQWGREITKRSMGVWLVARITIRLFVVY